MALKAVAATGQAGHWLCRAPIAAADEMPLSDPSSH
jgi:hypothetical protein